VEGVRQHDYRLMAADFQTQHQLRPSKKKACFHGILSFYPGEHPDNATLATIAQQYLQCIGITNTQYAIVKHTDRAHVHLHIIANMVNYDGKSISDNWIALRGKKVAQQLTKAYNLIPATGKNLQKTNLKALTESEANKYKIYEAICNVLPGCRSLEDLEQKLLQLGIQTQYKYKGQTTEKQGISFQIGRDCFKGSKVDRRFSLGNLQKTLDVQARQTKSEETKTQVYDDTQPLILRKRKFLPDESLNNSDEVVRSRGINNSVHGIIYELLRPEERQESDMGEFEWQLRKRKKKETPKNGSTCLTYKMKYYGRYTK
jgi:Relaxase/Mobilisation nuclease domain.